MKRDERIKKRTEDLKRAAALKAGPNSIVEEIGSSPAKRTEVDPTPGLTDPPVIGRELQAMTLKTFIATDFGPRRADQAAGFAHHAKREGPRTIHEWRKALAAFGEKPIK